MPKSKQMNSQKKYFKALSNLTNQEKEKLTQLTSKTAALCGLFIIASSITDSFILEELLNNLFEKNELPNKKYSYAFGLISSAFGSLALSTKLIQKTRQNFVLKIAQEHEHSLKESLEDFFSLTLPVSLISAASGLNFYLKFFLEDKQTLELSRNTLSTNQFASSIFFAATLSLINVMGSNQFHELFASEGREQEGSLLKSFLHGMTTFSGRPPQWLFKFSLSSPFKIESNLTQQAFMDFFSLWLKWASMISHISEIFFELENGSNDMSIYLFNIPLNFFILRSTALLIALVAAGMHANTEAMGIDEFLIKSGNFDLIKPFKNAMNPNFSTIQKSLCLTFLTAALFKSFFHILPDLMGIPNLLIPSDPLKSPQSIHSIFSLFFRLIIVPANFLSSFMLYAHAADDLIYSAPPQKKAVTEKFTFLYRKKQAQLDNSPSVRKNLHPFR